MRTHFKADISTDKAFLESLKNWLAAGQEIPKDCKELCGDAAEGMNIFHFCALKGFYETLIWLKENGFKCEPLSLVESKPDSILKGLNVFECVFFNPDLSDETARKILEILCTNDEDLRQVSKHNEFISWTLVEHAISVNCLQSAKWALCKIYKIEEKELEPIKSVWELLCLKHPFVQGSFLKLFNASIEKSFLSNQTSSEVFPLLNCNAYNFEGASPIHVVFLKNMPELFKKLNKENSSIHFNTLIKSSNANLNKNCLISLLFNINKIGSDFKISDEDRLILWRAIWDSSGDRQSPVFNMLCGLIMLNLGVGLNQKFIRSLISEMKDLVNEQSYSNLKEAYNIGNNDQHQSDPHNANILSPKQEQDVKMTPVKRIREILKPAINKIPPELLKLVYSNVLDISSDGAFLASIKMLGTPIPNDCRLLCGETYGGMNIFHFCAYKGFSKTLYWLRHGKKMEYKPLSLVSNNPNAAFNGLNVFECALFVGPDCDRPTWISNESVCRTLEVLYTNEVDLDKTSQNQYCHHWTLLDHAISLGYVDPLNFLLTKSRKEISNRIPELESMSDLLGENHGLSETEFFELINSNFVKAANYWLTKSRKEIVNQIDKLDSVWDLLCVNHSFSETAFLELIWHLSLKPDPKSFIPNEVSFRELKGLGLTHIALMQKRPSVLKGLIQLDKTLNLGKKIKSNNPNLKGKSLASLLFHINEIGIDFKMSDEERLMMWKALLESSIDDKKPLYYALAGSVFFAIYEDKNPSFLSSMISVTKESKNNEEWNEILRSLYNFLKYFEVFKKHDLYKLIKIHVLENGDFDDLYKLVERALPKDMYSKNFASGNIRNALIIETCKILEAACKKIPEDFHSLVNKLSLAAGNPDTNEETLIENPSKALTLDSDAGKFMVLLSKQLNNMKSIPGILRRLRENGDVSALDQEFLACLQVKVLDEAFIHQNWDKTYCMYDGMNIFHLCAYHGLDKTLAWLMTQKIDFDPLALIENGDEDLDKSNVYECVLRSSHLTDEIACKTLEVLNPRAEDLSNIRSQMKSFYNRSLVFHAIDSGYLKAVKYLVSKIEKFNPSSPDRGKDSSGKEILLECAWELMLSRKNLKEADCINLLEFFSRDCEFILPREFESVLFDGLTPIQLALLFGREESLSWLIKQNNKFDPAKKIKHSNVIFRGLSVASLLFNRERYESFIDENYMDMRKIDSCLMWKVLLDSSIEDKIPLFHALNGAIYCAIYSGKNTQLFISLIEETNKLKNPDWYEILRNTSIFLSNFDRSNTRLNNLYSLINSTVDNYEKSNKLESNPSKKNISKEEGFLFGALYGFDAIGKPFPEDVTIFGYPSFYTGMNVFHYSANKGYLHILNWFRQKGFKNEPRCLVSNKSNPALNQSNIFECVFQNPKLNDDIVYNILQILDPSEEDFSRKCQIKERSHWTLIHFAVVLGYIKTAKCLLSKIKNFDPLDVGKEKDVLGKEGVLSSAWELLFSNHYSNEQTRVQFLELFIKDYKFAIPSKFKSSAFDGANLIHMAILTGRDLSLNWLFQQDTKRDLGEKISSSNPALHGKSTASLLFHINKVNSIFKLNDDDKLRMWKALIHSPIGDKKPLFYALCGAINFALGTGNNDVFILSSLLETNLLENAEWNEILKQLYIFEIYRNLTPDKKQTVLYNRIKEIVYKNESLRQKKEKLSPEEAFQFEQTLELRDSGFLVILKSLLTAGMGNLNDLGDLIDERSRGMNVIHFCAFKGFYESLNWLCKEASKIPHAVVENNPHTDLNGANVFECILLNRNVTDDIARKILEDLYSKADQALWQAKSNIQNRFAWTLAHHALHRGFLDTFKYLLSTIKNFDPSRVGLSNEKLKKEVQVLSQRKDKFTIKNDDVNNKLNAKSAWEVLFLSPIDHVKEDTCINFLKYLSEECNPPFLIPRKFKSAKFDGIGPTHLALFTERPETLKWLLEQNASLDLGEKIKSGNKVLKGVSLASMIFHINGIRNNSPMTDDVRLSMWKILLESSIKDKTPLFDALEIATISGFKKEEDHDFFLNLIQETNKCQNPVWYENLKQIYLQVKMFLDPEKKQPNLRNFLKRIAHDYVSFREQKNKFSEEEMEQLVTQYFVPKKKPPKKKITGEIQQEPHQEVDQEIFVVKEPLPKKDEIEKISESEKRRQKLLQEISCGSSDKVKKEWKKRNEWQQEGGKIKDLIKDKPALKANQNQPASKELFKVAAPPKPAELVLVEKVKRIVPKKTNPPQFLAPPPKRKVVIKVPEINWWRDYKADQLCIALDCWDIMNNALDELERPKSELPLAKEKPSLAKVVLDEKKKDVNLVSACNAWVREGRKLKCGLIFSEGSGPGSLLYHFICLSQQYTLMKMSSILGFIFWQDSVRYPDAKNPVAHRVCREIRNSLRHPEDRINGMPVANLMPLCKDFKEKFSPFLQDCKREGQVPANYYNHPICPETKDMIPARKENEKPDLKLLQKALMTNFELLEIAHFICKEIKESNPDYFEHLSYLHNAVKTLVMLIGQALRDLKVFYPSNYDKVFSVIRSNSLLLAKNAAEENFTIFELFLNKISHDFEKELLEKPVFYEDLLPSQLIQVLSESSKIQENILACLGTIQEQEKLVVPVFSEIEGKDSLSSTHDQAFVFESVPIRLDLKRPVVKFVEKEFLPDKVPTKNAQTFFSEIRPKNAIPTSAPLKIPSEFFPGVPEKGPIPKKTQLNINSKEFVPRQDPNVSGSAEDVSKEHKNSPSKKN